MSKPRKDLASSPSSGPVPAGTQRSLGLIFFVMLMDIIGITLLSPVAAQIVLKYSNSALMVTMIPVVYASGQFFASPLLGKVGDRFGRRPVLLASLLGQALGYFIFWMGGSMWVLLLGRLIGGITSGNLSTSSAYIADVSKPEDRSKNFAMISTAWSLGLILGPAIGGLFGQFGLETPALAAGIVTLINFALGFFFLPESLPREKRHTSAIQIRDYNPFISIGDMARKPGLGLLILVNALFSFAFNGTNSTAALFMIEKFFVQTWQLSLMMMLSGAAIALVNYFLVPRWVPRFGEKITGSFGLIGLAFCSCLVFFAPVWSLAILAYVLGSTASAFIFPAITTLSVEKVPPTEAGQLMGVVSAIGSSMDIFGPLCAGLAYDHIMRGSPFWMGAITLLLAAYLLTRTSARVQVQNLPVDV